MTVSRALGNRPRVSEETRRKVLKIAQRLGYRPDPEITKLMHYLRRRIRPQFQSVICGITNWPTETKPAYFGALLEGAERQARERGYGFSVMRFAPQTGGAARLQRELRTRGVQGLLLLPQRSPQDLSELLDWREFSTVAASVSVVGPEVNRASPHHFANTLQLCRELTRLGYRRIGLVIDRGQDSRVNHGFSAAVVSHGWHGAGESMAPLLVSGDLREKLASWFKRERPDAIVTSDETAARECARLLRLKIPGPVGFACTSVQASNDAEPLIAGIDELPAEIGVMSVDLLASMVEHRVRGLPVAPTSTLLSGRWRPGTSCPRRKQPRPALA
ncbi:MAG: LacI family DNA-binding transcriptional regulator [Undibacterium sp.]|nr:LacI family DNA-binding transcriptional regulator [Opitutaceae bacterium]